MLCCGSLLYTATRPNNDWMKMTLWPGGTGFAHQYTLVPSVCRSLPALRVGFGLLAFHAVLSARLLLAGSINCTPSSTNERHTSFCSFAKSISNCRSVLPLPLLLQLLLERPLNKKDYRLWSVLLTKQCISQLLDTWASMQRHASHTLCSTTIWPQPAALRTKRGINLGSLVRPCNLDNWCTLAGGTFEQGLVIEKVVGRLDLPVHHTIHQWVKRQSHPPDLPPLSP